MPTLSFHNSLSHSSLFPHIQDTFACVHVWNMTSYKTVLWLDSDMLVVDSLAPLLSRAEELRPPQSAEPGPRIGVSYDWDWWLFISQYNHEPGMGGYWSGFNSGVFLIRPGMFAVIAIRSFLCCTLYYRCGGVFVPSKPAPAAW